VQYNSSKSGEVMTGLEDYVSRMKASQQNILYIAQESEELCSSSPFVESLVKKDVEVLYFTEPIDEWTAGQLAEFDGKKLVDVTKEGLEVDEDDKSKIEDAEARLKVRPFAIVRVRARVCIASPCKSVRVCTLLAPALQPRHVRKQ
jgi:molecular chaperone HtpG